MLLKVLHSDLKEFYSTLQEETSKLPLPNAPTSTVQLSKDVREFYADMLYDTAITAHQVKRKTIDMLDILDGRIFTFVTPEAWTYEDAVHEAQSRYEMIEVYTTPLPSLESIDYERASQDAEYSYEMSEIRAYLKTFDIHQMKKSIDTILQDDENINIVKVMYEELVPSTVSDEDFWMRHFYRCDPERIARYWSFHDNLGQHKRDLHVQSMKQNVHSTKQSFKAQVKTLVNWKDVIAAEGEAEYRRNEREVYTTPLSRNSIYEDDDDAVQEFLRTFDIDEMTEDITKVLQQHHKTVQKHFINLVPHKVSYKDFWQRYFYRCDPYRIEKELIQYKEHIRQQKKEVKQQRHSDSSSKSTWDTTALLTSKVTNVLTSLPKSLNSIKTKTYQDQSVHLESENTKEVSTGNVPAEPKLVQKDEEYNNNSKVTTVEKAITTVPTTAKTTHTSKEQSVLVLRQKLDEAKRRMIEAEKKIQYLRQDIEKSTATLSKFSGSIVATTTTTTTTTSSTTTDMSSIIDNDDDDDDFSTTCSLLSSPGTIIKNGNNKQQPVHHGNKNNIVYFSDCVKKYFFTD